MDEMEKDPKKSLPSINQIHPELISRKFSSRSYTYVQMYIGEFCESSTLTHPYTIPHNNKKKKKKN